MDTKIPYPNAIHHLRTGVVAVESMHINANFQNANIRISQLILTESGECRKFIP